MKHLIIVRDVFYNHRQRSYSIMRLLRRSRTSFSYGGVTLHSNERHVHIHMKITEVPEEFESTRNYNLVYVSCKCIDCLRTSIDAGSVR
jgi:hypothetical protein